MRRWTTPVHVPRWTGKLPRGATVYYRAFAGDSAVSETGRVQLTARKAGQNLTIAFRRHGREVQTVPPV